MRRRYELTDHEWSMLPPLLPNMPRGVRRADDRRALNGILWRFRTGSPGRKPKLLRHTLSTCLPGSPVGLCRNVAQSERIIARPYSADIATLSSAFELLNGIEPPTLVIHFENFRFSNRPMTVAIGGGWFEADCVEEVAGALSEASWLIGANGLFVQAVAVARGRETSFAIFRRF